MNKYLLIVLIVLLSSGFNYGQDNKIFWQKDVVTIDGSAAEWLESLRFYDNETQFHYGISNDAEDLYLCFYSSNPTMQMKLFRTGMSLELKSKKKPKLSAQIIFPKKDTTSYQMDRRRAGNNPQGNQSPEHRSQRARIFQQRLLEKNQTYEASGFLTSNGILPLKNENGVNISLNWDEKRRMTYEIKIPLNELFGADYSLKELSTKEFKLKIQVDAMEMPSFSGQRPQGGHPGGGRPQGGGQMQRDSGQMQQDRALLFEVQVLKHSFILASSPN